MSQFYQYTLPVADNSAIALAQAPVAPGDLILNGTYSNPVIGNVNLIQRGFVSQLTITSTEDLTGVDFEIFGSQNGVLIIESIIGPNAGMVTTVNYYDVVTKIVINDAAANVEVGFGGEAFFPLILVNTEKRISNVGYALQFIGEEDSSCTIYSSLANINSDRTYTQLIESGIMSYKQIVNNIETNSIVTVSAPSVTMQSTNVCKYLLVKVNDNQAALFTMQFLQL